MTLKILENIDTGYQPGKEYAAKVKCENCGAIYIVAIPKGYKINVQLQEERCPNCDCYDVLKALK